MKIWLLCALLTALRAGPPVPDQELERWMEALDLAREPEWSQALERLKELGEPAGQRALSGFEALEFTARRARARLLVEIPAPSLCPRVLELLPDPDPHVRRLFARLLGSPALAASSAAERVRALERLMLLDPDDDVRRRAREALVECALAEAVPALDRALDLLPPEEAEAVAAGLSQLPSAREFLIARLTRAGDRGALVARSPGVHAALLAGYGRALAEVPGGGEELRERLPILLGRTHPSLAVRGAARAALSAFVARAAELSEAERAERVLAHLGEEGWPRVECLRRRLDLAWLERGDPQAARELARTLARAARALPGGEAEAWELRAGMHEAAAAYALGDREEAVRLLGVLEQRLASARERREDLFPDPRANAKEPSEGGGAQAIERIALEALVHVWRALLELEARGLGAGVLEELRAAHVLFLEARVVALRTGASDPATLDALLAHDLSPHALVLFNERLAPERRGPALERAVMLAEGWGRAAPLELQGLGGEGAAERQIGDVFLDPRRLALLKEMRAAEHQDLQRQLDELDELDQVLLAPDGPEARANLERRIFHRHYVLRTAESDERKALDGHDPATLTSAELRAVHAQLLEYLTPSMHAHTLAGALRAEGRSREARELCERALSTLRTAPLASGTWSELSSARFELLRGSALMDEDRPREAEQALLEGERRLSAIEKRMEEWRRSALDPDAARQYEAQVRSLRGEALLSLAVNANVRQGDPAKALEYFERAFELNQSPFMRVLRACYRARSGRAEEARTVLASVVPVPSLYYNIACTYALLGEREQALDYLARDLRENHPSPGSLAQKRDWARGDPDLASLRGEPRFERLLGSD